MFITKLQAYEKNYILIFTCLDRPKIGGDKWCWTAWWQLFTTFLMKIAFFWDVAPMYSGGYWPTIQRSLLHPSSGWHHPKDKDRKQSTAIFILVAVRTRNLSCILNLCTRLRWVFSFTPRPSYPEERDPGTHWIGGWLDLRAGSFQFE
jgi:hypothetical protein